jgi:flagellar hook-associated protein 3 FlgL
MIFDAGVSSINKQTASLLRLQQQVSSGRRILAPSDDPVAAARALDVTQSQDITAQFKQNHDNATSALGLEETQLSSTGDLLARVRELAVQAGNTTLTRSDRLSITSELRSRFDELTGIANATDGSGQYLFSGFMGSIKPFSGTVASIVSGSEINYQGDNGQRKLQVSPTRFLEISDSGNDVFKRVTNGNGSFVTNYAVNGTGASTNTGAGVIDAGTIINTSATANNLAAPYTAAVTAATTTAGLATAAVTAAAAAAVLPGASAASVLANATVAAAPASMLAAAVPANTAEQLAVTAAAVGGATATDVLNAVNVAGTPAPILAAATAAEALGGSTPASVLTAVQAAAATEASAQMTLAAPGAVSAAVAAVVPAVPAPVSTAAATAAGLPGATPASVLAAVQVAAATPPYPALATAANATAVLSNAAITAATNAAGLGGATAASVLAAVPAVPASVLAAATVAAGLGGATPASVLAAVTAAAPGAVALAVPAPPAVGGVSASVSAAAATAAGLAATAVTAATNAAALGGATAASVLAAVPALPPTLKAAATAAAALTGATAASVSAAVSSAGPDAVAASVSTAITAATGSIWNLRPANSFSIKFSTDNTAVPPVTYYDIVNTDPLSPSVNNSMLTGAPPILPPTATTGQRVYQSGQPIVLNNLVMNVATEPASFGLGASVTITGTPASGDSFTIAPSSSQSIFATIGKLIGALEGATSGVGSSTATLSNDIGFALTNIDHATDNILQVRSQIGSRLKEIDSLSSANSDLTLQYQQTLSNLQDLDYAKTISDLTRNQTNLQAAQQSFVKVSQLSLFNYL